MMEAMNEISVWARFGAFVALILAGITLLILVPLPDVDQIRGWAQGSGPWVPLWFVVGYVVAGLLLVPRTVLSMAGGLVFGLATGMMLVWVAAMLGAITGFWVGRLLGRDGVDRLTRGRMSRLDEMVEQHGVFAVLIGRLAPVIPYAAVNYGSGLTSLRFVPYALATAVGITPGTLVYVAFGAASADPGSGLFLLSTVALLALIVGGWAYARRRGHSGPGVLSGARRRY